MRLTRALVLACLAACQSAPNPLASLDFVVPPILEQDNIPAAVIVSGDLDGVIYRRAFGEAKLDTIFDLASCTKVVATTTAAMKLVEEGRLSLDDPAGKYLKAFEGRHILIRELMHHCSGLPAYLTPRAKTSDAIIEEIASLKPGAAPVYSCLNMITLGRIVEQITGQPLADYARTTIFEPLGMKDTSFRPPADRCAPTTASLQGVVHDPLARTYACAEHQSGNAGLFSTGDDLALFCQALLRGKILKPETVAAMFEPDSAGRGLGWEIRKSRPYWPGVDHTGFTGTLVWMDPGTGRFAVVLTNRVRTGEQTSVSRLREKVLGVVNRP